MEAAIAPARGAKSLSRDFFAVYAPNEAKSFFPDLPPPGKVHPLTFGASKKRDLRKGGFITNL